MNYTNLDVYTCENCGMEILSDINTGVTSCFYCKNTLLLKNRLESEFNPDYIIPFKITKEVAIKTLKKFCKPKCLIPGIFNIKKYIKDIRGIYVPFRIYDFDSTGEIEVEGNKITTWVSNGNKYIKTDKYSVIRAGNISFDNISVCCSKKIENEIMKYVEPFDYKDFKKFNYSYLLGFLSEKYNLTNEEMIKEANNKAKNLFIEEMKKDIKGYDKITEIKNSINLNNLNSYNVLLPIWFLNIKYKNKVYTFVMNGQTGKIEGNIPVDIKKTIFMWISLFVIVFIVLLLLNLLKVIL